jgi:hypothetical protein
MNLSKCFRSAFIAQHKTGVGGGEKKLTLNNFDDGSKKNLAGKDFPLKNQEKHGSAIQKL